MTSRALIGSAHLRHFLVAGVHQLNLRKCSWSCERYKNDDAGEFIETVHTKDDTCGQLYLGGEKVPS